MVARCYVGLGGMRSWFVLWRFADWLSVLSCFQVNERAAACMRYLSLWSLETHEIIMSGNGGN